MLNQRQISDVKRKLSLVLFCFIQNAIPPTKKTLEQLQNSLKEKLENNHVKDTRNSFEARNLRLCREEINKTTTSSAVALVYVFVYMYTYIYIYV